MRIGICDDEESVRRMLADKVRGLYPEAEIRQFPSGEELLAADGEPDILFLDVKMPGMGGMEAAKKLRRRNRRTILIFLTAMEEYVFQAFDVGAFHYLVKPISEEKFKSVLSAAAERYRELTEGGLTGRPGERYLMVMSGGAHIKVSLEDIVYAEVFNRKVVIHKMEEDIEYYGKLSELAQQAGEDFFRTHRAYLVHFKYVVKYDASTIWMEKGKALLAKNNYPEFVKKFMRYNQKAGWGFRTW